MIELEAALLVICIANLAGVFFANWKEDGDIGVFCAIAALFDFIAFTGM